MIREWRYVYCGVSKICRIMMMMLSCLLFAQHNAYQVMDFVRVSMHYSGIYVCPRECKCECDPHQVKL
jgi:hypothetical protein